MDVVAKILIIYNDENTLKLVKAHTDERHIIQTVDNAFDALDKVTQWLPDLIIMETKLDVLTGYDVARQLYSDKSTQNIPILFIVEQEDDLSQFLLMGQIITGCVRKPIRPNRLIHELSHSLVYKTYSDIIRQIIVDKVQKIQEINDSLFYSLINATEFRDIEYGKYHIHRCVELSKILVIKMMRTVSYKDFLVSDMAEYIIKAVPYHDIGKNMISNQIILKPDKLTPEEYEISKSHTTVEVDISQYLPNDPGKEFINVVENTIRFHHECWDGSGYPDGLKGYEIPLEARIMTLIDQYDTMISRRIYKEPSSHFEAVKFIESHSGSIFDPALVEIFKSVQDEFLEISMRYREKID